MTTIYFVRHCKPDGTNKDDRNRPLTAEGEADSFKVCDILKDKKIDLFISSPYKRSFDTIKPAADFYGKQIETDERLRERQAGENSFDTFRKRWSDFDFAEEGGECLNSVQKRNIAALFDILDKYDGKTIALGTHGTALSSIMNYFDRNFAADQFLRIANFMPYIVKMDFDSKKLICKEDIFYLDKEYSD